MKTIVSSLEPLEARIAPAAVAVSYTDIDGDLVKITDSSGHLTAADLSFVGGGSSGQLAELNLTASVFAGASITFSVVYKAGGNGMANVGFIDAGTNDLDAVTVKGDLGRIDAGSGHGTAIQSLSVNSMGRLGTETQLAGGSLESAINGSLGSLTVAHDLVGALILVSDGGIGAVAIGGSLLGGSANDSGGINSAGNIGPVKIGQDVQGGGGISSGCITATDNLTSVTIGGSLIGGAEFGSGLISTEDGTMGAVKIGHDVQGGGDYLSGGIFSNGKLTSVTIGGSLLGGSGASSGAIGSNAGVGPVKITHNVQGGAGSGAGSITTGAGALTSVTIGGSLNGGSGSGSGEVYALTLVGPVAIGGNFTGASISGTTAALDSSGLIKCADGSITSVAIGGSILSGADTSTQGALTNNASIRAGHELGSLTVGGSLIGNPDGGLGNAASPVVISAGGPAGAVGSNDVAIGKITIGGRVEDAVILAGYDPTLTAQNSSAQIGAVKVGGDWIASDLAAGATNSDLPTGAPFPNFGNGSDAPISTGAAGIISKIASITIGGQVFGTFAAVNAADNFGFVAEQIGPVTIGGIAIKLAAGNNPQPVGETGDVDIHVIT